MATRTIKYAAVIGEYEAETTLGWFDTENEALAAIGRCAVDQNGWLRHQSRVDWAYDTGE